MNHPLAIQLDDMFLPTLEQAAADMRQRFRDVQFQVWRCPVGSATQFEGYDIGLECCFPVASPDQSDNVALTISLANVSVRPKIMAEVVWGHPSGHGEAAWRDDWQSSHDWPEANPETLRHVAEALPRLLRAFEEAVARGHPSV